MGFCAPDVQDEGGRWAEKKKILHADWRRFLLDFIQDTKDGALLLLLCRCSVLKICTAEQVISFVTQDMIWPWERIPKGKALGRDPD